MRTTLKRTKAWAVRASAGAVFALLVTAPTASGQSQPTVDPPYSMEELLFLVTSPVTEERIAALVADGCLAFEMTAFETRRLRDGGASLQLIGTLNEACVEIEEPVTSSPTAATTPPASTQDEEDRPRAVTLWPAGPGVYGSGSWFRMHYGSVDATKSGGITWGTMTSSFAEFGLFASGARTQIAPGGMVQPDVWSGETGASLNLFLMTPRPGRPLGLILGGLASFGRSWVEEGFSDGFNSYMYGWQTGAYGRVGGSSVELIPRIIWRRTTHKLASDASNTDPWTVGTVIFGAELKLGPVVPGVFAHVVDGATQTIVGLTFAY